MSGPLHILRWPVAAGVLLAASSAFAKEVNISSLYKPRNPGEGLTSNFAGRSYGLGGLSSPAGRSNDLLRSSISGPAQYTFERPKMGAPGLPSSELPKAGGGLSYKPVSQIAPSAIDFGKPAKGPMQPTRLFAADPNTESSAAPTLEQTGGPITTFVPAQPSEFGKCIEEGERLFREGRAAQAFEQFRAANYIESEAVTSFLGMVHAKFALRSYASAGLYLREALRFMPELPLVLLQPRAFYAVKGEYDKHMERLKEFVTNNPADLDARLLLVYFLWFGEDYQGARNQLTEIAAALKTAPHGEEMAEAVDIFQKAMESSGRLEPASQPAQAPSAPVPDKSAGQIAPAPDKGIADRPSGP